MLEIVCRSPPTRGRGLKLVGNTAYLEATRVAPYAGAWIETVVGSLVVVVVVVAPYAGAWIETQRASSRRLPFASPPTRGRGLKL